MLKRLVKNLRYVRFIDSYPRFTLGTLLVAILCTFLIIIATFSELQVRFFTMPEGAFIHPEGFFSRYNTISDFMGNYCYVPQIPAALFIGALLGPRISLISIFLYILAGLFGVPVFAAGGGPTYLLQQGCGYLLGFFLGAYLVGNILSKKISNFTLIRATIVGVLAVHLIGILYLILLAFIQHSPIFSLIDSIWKHSGAQILYDMFISFVAIALARPIRSILWVAMD